MKPLKESFIKAKDLDNVRTSSALQTGDVVKIATGEYGAVYYPKSLENMQKYFGNNWINFGNEDIDEGYILFPEGGINEFSYLYLPDYNDKLEYDTGDTYDIVKVFNNRINKKDFSNPSKIYKILHNFS